jgi:hypothetical protein
LAGAGDPPEPPAGDTPERPAGDLAPGVGVGAVRDLEPHTHRRRRRGEMRKQ